MERSTPPPTRLDAEPDTFPEHARAGAWGHDPHWHPHGIFITAVIGRGTLTIEDREYEVTPSSGVWVPPHMVHAGRFEPDLVPFVFGIRTNGVVAQPRVVPVDQALRASLLAWGRDAPGSLNHEQNLIRAIADAGDGHAHVARPTGPYTGTIAQALQANASDVRPLTVWAEELHTSVASIRRAFLSETGLTFSEWTTRRRLELSTARLIAGDMVSTVAHAAGFSVNGFTLAFRRWQGCTPSEFRVRYGSGASPESR